MTEDKGILIKNIYYMLSYAFQALRQNNYESIASEDFDNIYELFAEILAKGISCQLKQGLHREYISKHESLNKVKGKINISRTISNLSNNRHLIGCEFDELSENCVLNQIIKTTIQSLLSCDEIRNTKKAGLRQSLKNLLPYFCNVEYIMPKQIKWNILRFDASSKNYQMIIYICYFIIQSFVMTTEKGKYKMKHFSDEHMNMLYEKFILAYYKKAHPELCPRSSSVDWNIDYDKTDTAIIPAMHTDITLSLPSGKTLIIDAKYYGKTMIEHLGKKQIHSNNLYQIYAYVTNKDTGHKGNVNGILLYAKTQESIVPDNIMTLADGNIIAFKTLDLNQDFSDITKQLEKIIEQ